MAGEMFGAPAGIGAAQHDVYMGQLAQGQGLQNQEMALRIRQQQDMMRRMQQMGTGGSSPTNMLDMYTDAALASGNLDAAEKLSTMKSHIATAQKAQRDMQVKDSQLAANLFSAVRTPQDYANALAVYRAQGGMLNLPATYDPALVQQVVNGATKFQDRALSEERAARIAEAKARLPLIKAQTKLAEDRDRALGKSGGAASKRITANTKLASDMILKDYIGISPEEAYIYGRRIAERTVDLEAANPALKDTDATRMAYNELKNSGTFAPFNARAAHLGTRDNPAKIPDDPKKLVPNRYYTNDKGQTGKWTGKGFEVIAPGTPDMTDDHDLTTGTQDDSGEE